MSDEDAAAGSPRIDGLAIDEAVETIAGDDPDAEPVAVHATLEHVTRDGVVSRQGVEDGLTDAATAVQGAGTRIETVAETIRETREEAGEATDLGAVNSRLGALETDLAMLEDRHEELGGALRDLVSRRGDAASLYEVATDLRELVADAEALQDDADALLEDVGAFQQWLEAPDRRREELAADLDAVEEALADLSANVEALAEATADAEGAEDSRWSRVEDAPEPAAVWVDATAQARVHELLLADVRAELDDARALRRREKAGTAGKDGRAGEGAAAVAERLKRLETEAAALRQRLDAVARPAWRDRFDDRLARLDAALGSFEPPIDWGAVEQAIAGIRDETE